MPVTLVRYWGSFFKTPRQAQEFARVFAAAAARGWSTHLVCCRPPDDPGWLRPIEEVGTRIAYLPRPKRNFDAGVALRALRLCRRLDCDVFHCDNMHTSPLIGAALAGVPVRLWSKRSMQPVFEEGRPQTLRDRVAISVRTSCSLATQVLAVSSAVRDELVDLGVAPSKFTVLPNPVPELPAIDRRQARASFGYGDSELVITTVGHAVPVKGWDLLLEAFRQFSDEVPTARLLFVGSTTAPHEQECFAELQQLIERLEIADRVQFAGHVPSVFVPLTAADVFALPSRSEGYCNALLEAIRTGLPCVSARVGAAPDFIAHGESGLLTEREDAHGLGAALRAVCTDTELRERLAAAARGARLVWNLDEYAEGLVDLYASLLDAKMTPAVESV
jgi:glycosyltransferase involved in cell wall biosynthesis